MIPFRPFRALFSNKAAMTDIWQGSPPQQQAHCLCGTAAVFYSAKSTQDQNLASLTWFNNISPLGFRE